MTLRHPDLIGAAAIVAIAVVTIAGGITTPDPGFGVVPPAALPVVLGALMLASAAWLAWDTARTRRELAVEPLDAKPLAYTALTTAAFFMLFVPLGFVLSSAAFLIAQARILGSRSLARDAIASVVFVLAVYTLFVRFLTVALPNGPLPF